MFSPRRPLVVSIATAGWTAYRVFRWDKPVVSVTGTQWIGGSSSAPKAQHAGFSIEIYNTGNQATQVLSAAWQIDRGNGLIIHFKAVHGGGGIASLFKTPESAPPAPDLPFTLGRYEHREWEFQMPLDGIAEPEGIVRARPMVEYTSRKMRQVAYGAWQPSQFAIAASRARTDDLS